MAVKCRMTWIERTAYPRLPRAVSLKELRESFTPSDDEAWARTHTQSDGLHAKQSRGFDQTLAKAHRQLAEVSARLARGRTRKAREKVEAGIAAILASRWVARVIRTTLAGNDPAELRLSFGTDEEARAALEEELFGKRGPV